MFDGKGHQFVFRYLYFPSCLTQKSHIWSRDTGDER